MCNNDRNELKKMKEFLSQMKCLKVIKIEFIIIASNENYLSIDKKKRGDYPCI